MFGMKNQNKKLTKIPLEQFEDIFEYAKGIKGHYPILRYRYQKVQNMHYIWH